jgi:hypothetical protein
LPLDRSVATLSQSEVKYIPLGKACRELLCCHLFFVILKYLLGLLIAVGLSSHFAPEGTKRFFLKFFGKTEHIQISSSEFERQVKTRYQSEIGQLESLGFRFLFVEAQTFPAPRLLLGFPAVVLLMMWVKREVIALRPGLRLLTARPIFGSADNSTYAHPSGLGSMFHTGFKDGSLLVSCNYGQSRTYGVGAKGPVYTRHVYKAANIPGLWAHHQHEVRRTLTDCNPVATKMTFADYVEMI